MRILVYWYAHQTMQVKWGNSVSALFGVTNGVRQGGILSPILFNSYIDNLSKNLKTCSTWCMVGSLSVNHIMYADDLVVLSPVVVVCSNSLMCVLYMVNMISNITQLGVSLWSVEQKRTKAFNFLFLNCQMYVWNKAKYRYKWQWSGSKQKSQITQK